MNTGVRYLLDTDTCIYLMNGNPNVKNQLARVRVETIAVAAIKKLKRCFTLEQKQKK